MTVKVNRWEDFILLTASDRRFKHILYSKGHEGAEDGHGCEFWAVNSTEKSRTNFKSCYEIKSVVQTLCIEYVAE